MTYHYTLKNFLRQASNELIAAYFEARSFDLGLDAKTLKQRDVDPLADAIERLPEDAQTRINDDFQRVAAIGNPAGLLQIVQEARYLVLDIDAGLAAQKSQLNQAFWTFLTHPTVFEAAAAFAMPFTSGRYWKRGLPVTGARLLGDAGPMVRRLEDAVSDYFRREEGRGKACKVDYRRRDPVHRFHAYPEDYPAAPLAWSREGLRPIQYRPAFEVGFVFHEDAGSLDVYFEGGRQTVVALWRTFAAAVLGLDDLPAPDKPSYALGRLKFPGMDFVRPPGSPILDVRVKRIGFAILGYPATRISITTDVTRDRDAIHETVGRTFATGEPQPGRFALSQAKVISVTLEATIDPGDGKRHRTRSFDLSEKTCSLRYEGVDLQLRRMLIDSGIDQTGHAADAGESTPRQVA
ncbi:MAG: hypothetical protein AB7G10_28250 [Reyranellaceae bacterium]